MDNAQTPQQNRAIMLAVADFFFAPAKWIDHGLRYIYHGCRRTRNYGGKARRDDEFREDRDLIESIRIDDIVYRNISVYYHRHVHYDVFFDTNGRPMPLLVFIPGTAGLVAQFYPLIERLNQVSSCMAMDWPGCGCSGDPKQRDGRAEDPEALKKLLEHVIESHRDTNNNQKIVLIGHGTGSAYCAWIANPPEQAAPSLYDHVTGVIGICPISRPEPLYPTAMLRRRMNLHPLLLYVLYRVASRRRSEEPYIPHAQGATQLDDDEALRERQYYFDRQIRTRSWRRLKLATLPVYEKDVTITGSLVQRPKGGLADLPTWWSRVDKPVFLVAGEGDEVTPMGEKDKIKQSMRGIPEDLAVTTYASDLKDPTLQAKVYRNDHDKGETGTADAGADRREKKTWALRFGTRARHRPGKRVFSSSVTYSDPERSMDPGAGREMSSMANTTAAGNSNTPSAGHQISETDTATAGSNPPAIAHGATAQPASESVTAATEQSVEPGLNSVSVAGTCTTGPAPASGNISAAGHSDDDDEDEGPTPHLLGGYWNSTRWKRLKNYEIPTIEVRCNLGPIPPPEISPAGGSVDIEHRVKEHTFDPPANHTLLYSPERIDTLAAEITNFLQQDIILPSSLQ